MTRAWLLAGLIVLGVALLVWEGPDPAPARRAPLPPRTESATTDDGDDTITAGSVPHLSLQQAALRLHDPDPAVRWQSLRQLIAAGAESVPAMLELFRLEAAAYSPGDTAWTGRNWMTRCSVIYAILAIGEPAIDPLLRAIAAGDGLRSPAIRLLGHLGKLHPAAVVPHLRPLLREEATASTAAFAIGRIGPPAIAALPELVAIFDQKDLAWAGADNIVDLGPGAVPAIEKVLLRTHSGRLMGNLASLDADKRPLVPAMIEVLHQGKPFQKRDAAWALDELGPVAVAARPALRQYAYATRGLGWSTSITGNTCCVNALISIGVEDQEVERLVQVLLKHKDPPNEAMLRRIGRCDPDRVHRLARLLLPGLLKHTYNTAWGLALLGPEVAPILRKHLASSNKDLARFALQSEGDPRALLLHADPGVRRDAVDRLARLGARVPVALLDDPHKAVRLSAACALAGTEERATAMLIESLGGYRDREIVAALRRSGAARHALPKLLELQAKVQRGGRLYSERAIPETTRLLRELAPLPAQSLGTIRAGLTAVYAADRIGSALILQRCGVDPAEYMQVLLEGMRPANWRHLGMSSRRHRPESVRVAAIEALAPLGDRAAPAIPLLASLREDRSRAVRAAAKTALARLR